MIFESYTSKGVPKKALFFYFGFSVGYAILFIGHNKGGSVKKTRKSTAAVRDVVDFYWNKFMTSSRLNDGEKIDSVRRMDQINAMLPEFLREFGATEEIDYFVKIVLVYLKKSSFSTIHPPYSLADIASAKVRAELLAHAVKTGFYYQARKVASHLGRKLSRDELCALVEKHHMGSNPDLISQEMIREAYLYDEEFGDKIKERLHERKVEFDEYVCY